MQQGDKFPHELSPFLDAPNLIYAIELGVQRSPVQSRPRWSYMRENEAAAREARTAWSIKRSIHVRADDGGDAQSSPPSKDPVEEAALEICRAD